MPPNKHPHQADSGSRLWFAHIALTSNKLHEKRNEIKPIHPPTQELRELTTVASEVPHQQQSPSEQPVSKGKTELSPHSQSEMCETHKSQAYTHEAAALADGMVLVPPVLAGLQKGQ